MHNNEKTGDVTPDGESTLTIDFFDTKIWRDKQGHYHRLDGPAIERVNGDKRWYINGKGYYIYEDWKKEVEHRKNLDTIYGKGSEVDLNLKGFNA